MGASSSTDKKKRRPPRTGPSHKRKAAAEKPGADEAADTKDKKSRKDDKSFSHPPAAAAAAAASSSSSSSSYSSSSSSSGAASAAGPKKSMRQQLEEEAAFDRQERPEVIQRITEKAANALDDDLTHDKYMSSVEWRLIIAATPAIYDYGYRAGRYGHTNIELMSHLFPLFQSITDPFARSVQQLGGDLLCTSSPAVRSDDLTKKFIATQENMLSLQEMRTLEIKDEKGMSPKELSALKKEKVRVATFVQAIREWMAQYQNVLDPIRHYTRTTPRQTFVFRGIGLALRMMDGFVDQDTVRGMGQVKRAAVAFVGKDRAMHRDLRDYITLTDTTRYPINDWTAAMQAAIQLQKEKDEEENRKENGEEEEED